MAPHSSTLAWKIPWTEEPGRLQSMGSLRSRTRLSKFTFIFHFPALEKEMATHSSVLAWRIPGMGEPGAQPSMGSHRVGHDWSDLAVSSAYMWNLENGIDDLIGKAESETQIQRTNVDIKEGNGEWDEFGRWGITYIHYWCMCVCVQSLNCVWPCNPMDCSPADPSVHRILSAQILEWVAISSSRGSSWPRDRTHISCIDRQILYYCTSWEALHYRLLLWFLGCPTLLILCIKQTTSENPLYSSTQCSTVMEMGRKSKKEVIYVYMWLIHFVV